MAFKKYSTVPLEMVENKPEWLSSPEPEEDNKKITTESDNTSVTNEEEKTEK